MMIMTTKTLAFDGVSNCGTDGSETNCTVHRWQYLRTLGALDGQRKEPHIVFAQTSSSYAMIIPHVDLLRKLRLPEIDLRHPSTAASVSQQPR